ncbi:MAG: tyrosine-type recombinase/integrase [Spirulina sp.]
MYSEDRKYSERGMARLESASNRLRVRFPREIFGGKAKALSLAMADTEENRIIAQRKVDAINADIINECLDLTLEKYKPKAKQASHLEKVKELYPDISVRDLWEQYLEYKKTSWKETTLLYAIKQINPIIQKLPITSPHKALEIRQWLLSNTTEGQTKRVLIQINAAFNWGLKHKKLKGKNPFDGMSKELKHNYEKGTEPNPFTKEEKERVINAFRNHKGNWNGRGYTGYSYEYYTSFVEFLFMSGCRPNEAAGLRWGNINNNLSRITFNGGIVTMAGKLIEVKGSKNNKQRIFPCNNKLRNLLEGIKPNNVLSESLVFPSPTGKAINTNNFNNKAWKTLVSPIKKGTTLYCCRDTFISQQIDDGIPPARVAQWCDTSVAVIEKHYLGKMTDNILPSE